MDPIRSGTTTERLIRTTLLAVVINAFAAAFLWDGYSGYARENAAALADSLGISPDPQPRIDMELTSMEATRLVAQIAIGASNSQVMELLGEPGLESGDRAYYLGAGGHITVRWGGDEIVSAEWVDASVHTETDLSWQGGIGAVLTFFGLFAILQLIRVVRTRAEVTDKGLKIRGKPLVSFETMTGFVDDGANTGVVRLGYRDGNGRSYVLLDEYIFKQRDAIIDALCEQTGFSNPLRAERES